MQSRRAAAMMSATNEYSALKWPVTLTSVLTTLLALFLLLSFRSNAWFTYELVRAENRSNTTTGYSQLLEYGSIGLWTICVGHYDEPIAQCDQWTKASRPHSFNVIMVLISIALFLANLTVFPSWGTSILLLYNANNRYMRPIVGFLWILLLLTLSLTSVLMVAMLLTALTQFYSPGMFSIDSNHLLFHSGDGLFYAGFATCLAVTCSTLIIFTLIWKKLIEMKLIEAEKDLLRQLNDDSYQTGWHKLAIAPRTPLSNDEIGAPPPYDYQQRSTKK